MTGFFSAHGQAGGGGKGLPLPADRNQIQRRILLHQQIEPVGFAVRQPDHMGNAVLFQFAQHNVRAELGFLLLRHTLIPALPALKNDAGPAVSAARIIA